MVLNPAGERQFQQNSLDLLNGQVRGPYDLVDIDRRWTKSTDDAVLRAGVVTNFHAGRLLSPAFDGRRGSQGS